MPPENAWGLTPPENVWGLTPPENAWGLTPLWENACRLTPGGGGAPAHCILLSIARGIFFQNLNSDCRSRYAAKVVPKMPLHGRRMRSSELNDALTCKLFLRRAVANYFSATAYCRGGTSTRNCVFRSQKPPSLRRFRWRAYGPSAPTL